MRYEEQLRGLEKARAEQSWNLSQQIKSLNEMNESCSGRRRASRRPCANPR